MAYVIALVCGTLVVLAAMALFGWLRHVDASRPVALVPDDVARASVETLRAEHRASVERIEKLEDQMRSALSRRGR